MEFQSEVGPDGMLSLQVPLGKAEARTRVLVSIRPLPTDEHLPVRDQSPWEEFVEHTYGSCAGLGLEEPADLPLAEGDWPQ